MKTCLLTRWYLRPDCGRPSYLATMDNPYGDSDWVVRSDNFLHSSSGSGRVSSFSPFSCNMCKHRLPVLSSEERMSSSPLNTSYITNSLLTAEAPGSLVVTVGRQFPVPQQIPSQATFPIVSGALSGASIPPGSTLHLSGSFAPLGFPPYGHWLVISPLCGRLPGRSAGLSIGG